MTGIIKTDQLQGAQSTTVTVPTGHTLAVTGAFTSQGIDDNANATAITIDSNEDITITKQGTNTTDVRFANSSNSFGGNIKYDHSVGNMIFNVHNGERARFRSDGGICFNGDTAAANALDDYEEGSWTPSVAGNTTYDNQIGRYVKIGNKVTLWFYIQINQRNSPGVPYIAGSSPFTNSSAITGSGLVHYFEGIQNNAVVLTARIDPGGANINISGSTGSGGTTTNVNHDWVKNGGDIYGFVTHYTGS